MAHRSQERYLLITGHHGQQQQHSANDTVDEHANEHEEGEEGCAPLVVHPDHHRNHDRYEDHDSKVDILPSHPPAHHSHCCTLLMTMWLMVADVRSH